MNNLIIQEFTPYLFNKNIEDFVSPPFDTITYEQEQELRQKKYNIVKLTVPDKNGGITGSQDILKKWIDDGTLLKFTTDSIIIMKQEFYNNKELIQRYGIISLVDIMEDVKTHEYTFPTQVKERKDVMYNLNSEPEPIFIIVPDNNFDKLIKRESADLDEKYKFYQPNGVLNTVYFLTDGDKINKIKNALKNDTGIVADGHHRMRAITELYEKTGDNFWRYAMAYTTSVYDNGLMIGGVHRLLYGLSLDPYLNKLNDSFDVTVDNNMVNQKNIYIYHNSKFYCLIPKNYIVKEKFGNKSPLSTEIVNKILFEQTFSLREEEYNKKIIYIYNYTDAINAVDMHQCDFAILIPQWQKEDFLKFMVENRLMPQKSTYFYPKIPSGIALYIKPL